MFIFIFIWIYICDFPIFKYFSRSIFAICMSAHTPYTDEYIERNEWKFWSKRRGLIVFQNNLIIQISPEKFSLIFLSLLVCSRVDAESNIENAKASNKHCTLQSNSIPFQKVENYAMNYLKLSSTIPARSSYHQHIQTQNIRSIRLGLQNITYRISKVIRFRLISLSLTLSLFLCTQSSFYPRIPLTVQF